MATAKTKQPRLRAVWLGQALREIREEAGYTTRQMGEHIGRDASTISRIENGEMPVPERILNDYLEVCGVTDTHRAADLAIIRRDAAHGGWWDGYQRDVAAVLMDRAWMESRAVVIRSFEIAVLPGMLQLPSYAEALMRTTNPGRDYDEIQRWVEMRMQRQHILTKHRPVTFHAIIDHQLLRRTAGGKAIMKEQLDYLVEVGQRTNVEIRVIPSDKSTGISGSFELFELANPYPEIGYVATTAGDLCVEGDGLERMSREYNQLHQASLDPEASRDLISAERDAL